MSAIHIIRVLSILGLLAGVSCASTEKCLTDVHSKIGLESYSANKIWVPEHFVYERGRYRFFKGYYRLISRKAHWKRSMRGYVSIDDYPAAR